MIYKCIFSIYTIQFCYFCLVSMEKTDVPSIFLAEKVQALSDFQACLGIPT